jgi:hypothetical protein
LLIDLANERGGHDNATVAVIKVVDMVAEKPSLPWVVVGALAAVLLFGLAGLCVSTGPLSVAPLFYKDTAVLTLQPVNAEGTPPISETVQSSIVPTPTPGKPTSIAPASPTPDIIVVPLGSPAAASSVLPVFGWEIVPPTPE